MKKQAKNGGKAGGKAGKGGTGKGKEPSLKEAIAESGETEANPLRAALGDDRMDRKFLGREFLTWLLYHADDDNGGGLFTIAAEDGEKDGGEFKIQPGERVLLKAIGDGAGEIAARGAAPAQTADVRYCIAGGLTVREVEIFFLRGDRTWQLTVTAEMFDIKRAKVPELLSEEDLGRAQERLTLIDEMERMLREAYRAFLKVRLQPSWQRVEVPRIRAWLEDSILEKEQQPVIRPSGPDKDTKSGPPRSQVN